MNSREKSKISTQFTDHSYHSFSESKYDSIPISEISKKKEVVNLADTIFHDALIIHKISQFLDCNELLLYLISLNKKSSQVVKNYIQKNFTYSDIQKLFEKADKELKTAESNIRTVSRGCFFLTQLNFDRLKIEFRNSSSPKELEKLIESEKITYSNAISMDHFRIGCCLGFQTSYLVAGLGSIFCGPWFGLTSCCANFWAQYAVSCAGTLCLSCASGSCVSHYEKNYGYFTQYNEKPNVKNYFTALREYKKLSFWHMQVKNKEELKNVVTEPELAEAPRVFL